MDQRCSPVVVARAVVAGVVLCMALAACEAVRAVTYPPSFQYVEPERLHDAMWGLADRVSVLDAALREEGAEPGERKARVGALLDEMKALASKVSAPGQQTNHPMLSLHLGDFQLDLALARAALDRDPVDFAPAGRITGACLYCHTGTGGGPQRRQ